MHFCVHMTGLRSAVRDGREVCGHAPDSAAAEEVRADPAGEDAVPVLGSTRPLEQPQDQGVSGQTEAGTSHSGGISQHFTGRVREMVK